jgi:hypothetical protein
MTECTQETISSDKHLPPSPFSGTFLYMTTFYSDFYESHLSTPPKYKLQCTKNEYFKNIPGVHPFIFEERLTCGLEVLMVTSKGSSAFRGLKRS